jgi:hypothetical protein
MPAGRRHRATRREQPHCSYIASLLTVSQLSFMYPMKHLHRPVAKSQLPRLEHCPVCIKTVVDLLSVTRMTLYPFWFATLYKCSRLSP